MRILLALIFLLAVSASTQAATWYVRNDGGTTVQCTGQANAAYDGSGSGEACAYANPADAITAASCNDTIRALAGDTFDTTVLTLPNKSCSVSDPITITSTATLPNRRVTVADASLMPRFRTTSAVGDGVFRTATNAGWWVLDGLEITDNAGENTINQLLDFGVSNTGAHDMVVTRCYMHQKETGTDYERSVVRAVQFEGTNLTISRSHIYLIGHSYSTTEPYNTEALLSVGGPCAPCLLDDNYINVWYNGVFLGGGDTAPQHTATLTSASTTSATYSDVTGIVVGQFHRFSVVGTATLSNAGMSPTLAKDTGADWVALDGNHNGNWGDSILITSVADPSKFGIARMMVIDEGLQTATTMAANSSVAAIPNGAVTYVLYQTAKVTNIAGSVITYDPEGTTAGIAYNTNALNKVPASAAWNAGDEGRIVDVTVTNNTIESDLAFSIYAESIGRGCPKGAYEIKSVDRFTFQYNIVGGYPAVLAMTTANQNGSAPWITVDHILIDSNWIKPEDGYPECTRSAFLIADDAYLNTITPTTSVTITNNLVERGVREFAQLKNGGTWTITHNTSINSASSDIGPNALLNTQVAGLPGLIFKDNIGDVVCYGFQGYPGDYTSPTILNNLLVDTAVGCSGGININTFGTNSGLAPIPTSFSGLFDPGTYRIPTASPYHNAGSDNTDPGIVWATPNAPWLTPSSRQVRGRLNVRGRIIIPQ